MQYGLFILWLADSRCKTQGYGFRKDSPYKDAVSIWIEKYLTRIVSELGDEELVSALGIKKHNKKNI